jgi:hypothetical protein
MSWGLQRAWARAKAGSNNSGVPTYRIRSRHESSIHNFGLVALTGAAGAVWTRENALSCCISSGTKFSLSHRENQSRSSRQKPVLILDVVRAFPAPGAKLM